MLTLLLTLLLAPVALAASGEQQLIFDLVSNGAVIGRREVTVRYLPAVDAGSIPSRIIESWTELDAQENNWDLNLRHRSTAHVSHDNSSFTSSISIDGKVSEVQGQLLPDGRWQMYKNGPKGERRWDLRRTEVNLSSLDLFDPKRSALFTKERARVRMLSVETGEVLLGPIIDMGEEMIEVNNRQVQVHRYAWVPEGARFEMAWSEDGLLLDWSVERRGQRLDANIRELPTEQIYGQINTIEEIPQIVEEEL